MWGRKYADRRTVMEQRTSGCLESTRLRNFQRRLHVGDAARFRRGPRAPSGQGRAERLRRVHQRSARDSDWGSLVVNPAYGKKKKQKKKKKNTGEKKNKKKKKKNSCAPLLLIFPTSHEQYAARGTAPDTMRVAEDLRDYVGAGYCPHLRSETRSSSTESVLQVVFGANDMVE